MKISQILKKYGAVVVSAAMLLSTGFTTVGQYIGTDVSVSATDTDIVASGKCGDNVTYTLDSSGTLTILGSGDINETYHFYSYKNDIKNIIINNGVKTIGFDAFTGCTNLTNISIPDSVTSIYAGAFSSCQNLKNINIPNSVTKIEGGDSGVFSGCGLYYILFPNKLNKLEVCVCSYCQNLKYVVIPKSITDIDACTFQGCCNLTDIYYEGTEQEWKKINIDSDNEEILKATIHYNYQYPDSNELKNNSEISADKIVLGSKVNLTAKADGGKGDYTYAIYYKKKTDTKWVTVQNFNTNTTATFKPAKATEYDVCVKVKDADGKIVKKYFTITVNGALENISSIWTNNGTICLGETVAVNADAKGGTGDYKYAVLYKKKSDTKWTVKQNYTANQTIYIKPSKAADYDICVKVQDTSGKIVKKFLSLTVYNKLENTSAIVSSTVTFGDKVTVNASAAGGSGNYTYALLCKKKSDTKWTTKQNYSTNSNITFTPEKITDYDVCVKVQDNKGNITKKFFDVTVKQNPTYQITVKYLEQVSLAQYLNKSLDKCAYDIEDNKYVNVARAEESTIEGLKVGITTMKVHDGISLKTFNVSVIPNDIPPKITPSNHKLTLKVGATGTFTCKPQNGIDNAVLYSTYTPSICTISQKGEVKAWQVGYGTVAARLSDGQIITCTVEIVK